jgi:hypothetical protein
MATYYGVKGSSNWNSGNWSLTSAKDATRTGSGVTPTASDNCILDDWSSDGGGVTWTINATTCACQTLNCTGYAGTLAFTSSQKLTVSGSVTFTSSMTCTGAGNLTVSTGTIATGGIAVSITTLSLTGSVTMNTNGTTWGNIDIDNAITLTLTSNLTCSGSLYIKNGLTFSGAYNISCGTLKQTFFWSGSTTLTIVSGQTLTVTTSLLLSGDYVGSYTITVRSGTASSAAYLTYQGTVANCKIAGVTFTDIDASGSAQGLDNWYGGTLTRCTNITNRTSTDIGGGGLIRHPGMNGGLNG